MAEYIALIRGINVGRAKRVAMVDLRAAMVGLGHTHVRTLRNSGNVVFESARASSTRLARAISACIEGALGFSAEVVVITAAQLTAIVHENPLLDSGRDASRVLVVFVADRAVLVDLRRLAGESWAPEQFAVGKRAAYLWCPDGVIKSKLMGAVARAARDAITTRNWSTVLELYGISTGGRR